MQKLDGINAVEAMKFPALKQLKKKNSFEMLGPNLLLIDLKQENWEIEVMTARPTRMNWKRIGLETFRRWLWT